MATVDGKKTGGRKKGQRNKETVEAEALAKKLGVDPFEILLLFAKGDWEALGYESKMQVVSVNESGSVEDYTIPVAVRAKCAEKATEFLRPKLKSLDVSADGLKDVAMLSFTALMAQAALDAAEPDDTAATS
jgi:hypothetical protein